MRSIETNYIRKMLFDQQVIFIQKKYHYYVRSAFFEFRKQASDVPEMLLDEMKQFEGKVIAVWHRFDDVEDKWIVSLDEEDIADEKILGDISFQEQFFYGKLYR